MHKKVLLVGAGQLGSRYLQGLAKVSIPLEIHVLDISESSLRIAEARWNEVDTSEKDNHNLFFSTEIKTVPAVIDLAVVSTGANIRAALVKNISEACEVEYWILEKVLAQSEDEIHAIINSLSREGSTWVNTPRRAMKWHQNIKTHLLSNVPVEFTICGGQWGLACNAIHFLDLVQWWTGETLLAVDTGHLDKGWIPSKRHGFFEIFGTITARFSNGSQATLTANGSNAPLTNSVKQEGLNWIIREQAGEAERSDGLIIKGSMEFQSTIAQKIVEDILINGKCELPSLVESAGLHKPFLRDMLSHWNQCGDKKVEMLPIT